MPRSFRYIAWAQTQRNRKRKLPRYSAAAATRAVTGAASGVLLGSA